MGRAVLGLDRLLALLAGVVLLVAGAATAAWGGGWLVRVWSAAPRQLQLKTATDTFAATWWPWAAGVTGAVLVLLGLWWLLAHLPRRGVGTLVLPGSDKHGRLLLEPAGAATAAAEVLEEFPGVRSAGSRVLRDRGQLVVELKALVEPTADLTAVVAATDAVSADLHQVLDRDDARARVHLSVARRARRLPRVH
ncbi:hypothetical protein [Kineococcus aurantiacus]|uniref:Alkaline shock response membrane anchor protein AmaP n=1 Tax=Kineococcus aurantiacus TaxID=37633 RepID=A0A7Y9DJC4_9ACTN|nr:hypothetical protein [Kineococcus aurantiacus]NYD20518.1 hypothetical protein [Kineococcus aurantiacus]